MCPKSQALLRTLIEFTLCTNYMIDDYEALSKDNLIDHRVDSLLTVSKYLAI